MKRFVPVLWRIFAAAAIVVLLLIAVRLLLYARTVATMGPIPY